MRGVGVGTHRDRVMKIDRTKNLRLGCYEITLMYIPTDPLLRKEALKKK